MSLYRCSIKSVLIYCMPAVQRRTGESFRGSSVLSRRSLTAHCPLWGTYSAYHSNQNTERPIPSLTSSDLLPSLHEMTDKQYWLSGTTTLQLHLLYIIQYTCRTLHSTTYCCSFCILLQLLLCMYIPALLEHCGTTSPYTLYKFPNYHRK